MVTAVVTDRSLWAMSWALAEPALRSASPASARIFFIASLLDEAAHRGLENDDERLAQLGCNLVDAGLGAGFVLVAARCAGNADGADGVVADHDRQRALGCHE